MLLSHDLHRTLVQQGVRTCLSGLGNWPTPRPRLALGKLDHVAIRPPWCNDCITNGGTIKRSKQLVQGPGVYRCSQDEGCKHSHLSRPNVACSIDGIAEFVNALVQGIRNPLTEWLWIGLGETLVGVVARRHIPSAAKASFDLSL